MTLAKLPYPKVFGLKNAVEYVLQEPLFVVKDDLNTPEDFVVAAGTKVKLAQTNNFGVCVLPQGARTTSGELTPQLILRW